MRRCGRTRLNRPGWIRPRHGRAIGRSLVAGPYGLNRRVVDTDRCAVAETEELGNDGC
jgi:hypothetical protein